MFKLFKYVNFKIQTTSNILEFKVCLMIIGNKVIINTKLQQSHRDLSGCPDGSYGLVFERPVESTGPDQNIGIFYRNLPQDRLP